MKPLTVIIGSQIDVLGLASIKHALGRVRVDSNQNEIEKFALLEAKDH